MDFFYHYILPIGIVELLAALVGTFFLIRNSIINPHKWVVYYLWMVILIESYGYMVGFSKHSDYSYFGFLKDTFFQESKWVYNIFELATYVFFVFYFLNFLKNKKLILLIKSSTLVYLFISVVLLLNINTLLLPNIPFINLTGSILLLVTILFYFLSLLKSDKLIELKRDFTFYVALGFVFFILSTTPLSIYFKYYDISINEMYVQLRANVFLYINLFLYSTLTLGFIVCFRRKKSY